MKSQFIYVNSAHRNTNDKPYDFEIDIPDGQIRCNVDNEHLSITTVFFKICKQWYYVNSTNNLFAFFFYPPNSNVLSQASFYIPEGNYTFKRLASKINEFAMGIFTVTYDQNTNKYNFDMPTGWKLDFTSSVSCWYLLGFNKNDIITKQVGVPIVSTNILSIYLSKSINVKLVNVIPNDASCIENTVENNTATKLGTNILCVANDFPPYTSQTYESQDSKKYALDVKNKDIRKLRLQVVDENQELLTFITDYIIVLRIDTISSDKSLEENTLKALQSIEEYQRLKFVSNNLDKI